MLTKVEIRTEQGKLLVLPLGDYSDGFLIKDIDGLDPVKATIVSSNFATIDGAQYQSSRREARNIVFKLGLQLGVAGSIRSLRNELYAFLMPKAVAHLRFYDDEIGYVDISGRVESFDCPMFVKDPEATISLLCLLPDFYSPSPKIVEGFTTSQAVNTTINYGGTIETGIKFKIQPNRTLSDFIIEHRHENGLLGLLDFEATLGAGDMLELSTVSGAKGAWVTNGGTRNSILYGIAPYSNYINLFPGMNTIRVYAEGVAIPYTIEYTDKFGGL